MFDLYTEFRACKSLQSIAMDAFFALRIGLQACRHTFLSGQKNKSILKVG